MMHNRDDVVLALAEDDVSEPGSLSSQARASRRKCALIGHFAFRTAGLVVYLFCSWFTTAFILPVVVVLVLQAVDFWVVKNISGRLLVRLRWWNQVGQQGGSSWFFESPRATHATSSEFGVSNAPPSRRAAAELSRQTHTARLFWFGLLFFPFLWTILFIVALLSLKVAWALVALSAISLTGINLYGYLRCRFFSTNSGETDSNASIFSLFRSNITKSVISDLLRGTITTNAKPIPDPISQV